MLILKEELVLKGLEVYLDGVLIPKVAECDPANGWVRIPVSRKPNSGSVTNLCIKQRGKVELRAKVPAPKPEIGVVKPKVPAYTPRTKKQETPDDVKDAQS